VQPLSPRNAIPLRGFGTWLLREDACRAAVETALDVGYRHIDTAPGYGNHAAVRAAIQASGIPRDELFVTTKVPHEQLHQADLVASCRRSLDELGLDQVDLFLIHWPNPDIPLAESLEAMRELLDAGLIRRCGVSNFTVERLRAACALDTVPIAVNQIELHPYLKEWPMLEAARELGVTVTAYSPLGFANVLSDETIGVIARRHGRTPAAVILRWHLQLDVVAVPKATSRDHIRDNFGILDLELSDDEMAAIGGIDRWERYARPDFVSMAGLP
jgi:diketogulonate reductase-like aldo/keto reductase